MHFYPFHIGDYAKHTKGLSVIEDIAYRRILDEYYLSEQPLNGSTTDVARLIGMREYFEDVAYVLNRFFVPMDGKWFSSRADVEIKKYHGIVEKKSKAGKASAEARKNKRTTDVEHVLNTQLTHEVQTKNQEPRTNSNKYRSAEQTVLDSFESFWNAYAKKKGKQNAMNQWKRIKPDAELAGLITKKAQAYANATEIQFRKDPERWLKGKHWEDEIISEPAGKSTEELERMILG